ncbi:hypothetical protein Moror_16929, partial [Moniliophthora roreri MCA 2997]
MVQNWRDDIDTLLVFAGLFSAVVTAFAIESYQWLDVDPADTTVVLLTQMIALQFNGSQTLSPEVPQFEPDASAIRINCFWFLSLVFSLISSLFALLCKQWIREHKRDTPTRTPGEALALRQLRRESLEKWGIPSFISALPILLELALFFFFIGVLDLLWNRHHLVFALTFAAVMLSVGLYVVTTLLPTVTAPWDQTLKILEGRFDELSYQFTCPYKSPQAWLVYHLFGKVVRTLLKFSFINDYAEKHAWTSWVHIKSPVTDWSSLDLQVVRQFDQTLSLAFSPDDFRLRVYELRAMQWAVTMFRDSPFMLPHLRNILKTMPPSLSMSAVLSEWAAAAWLGVLQLDVELVLRTPDVSSRQTPLFTWLPAPTIREPILHDPEGIRLLFCHQYWITMANRSDLYLYMDKLLESIEQAHSQQYTGLRFIIPFAMVDVLWTHDDMNIQRQSLQLLQLFEESWRPREGDDRSRHDEERLAFVASLTRHLERTNIPSALLRSRRGRAFIEFIDNELKDPQCALFGKIEVYMTWPRAIKRAKEAGCLPSNYGESDYLPDLDSIQYPLDIVPDLELSEERLYIVISNEMGKAGPPEGELVRDPQDSALHMLNIDGQVVSNAPENDGIDPLGNTIPDHSGLNIDVGNDTRGSDERYDTQVTGDQDGDGVSANAWPQGTAGSQVGGLPSHHFVSLPTHVPSGSVPNNTWLQHITGVQGGGLSAGYYVPLPMHVPSGSVPNPPQPDNTGRPLDTEQNVEVDEESLPSHYVVPLPIHIPSNSIAGIQRGLPSGYYVPLSMHAPSGLVPNPPQPGRTARPVDTQQNVGASEEGLPSHYSVPLRIHVPSGSVPINVWPQHIAGVQGGGLSTGYYVPLPMHISSGSVPNPTQPAPTAHPVDTELDVEANEETNKEVEVNAQLSGQPSQPDNTGQPADTEHDVEVNEESLPSYYLVLHPIHAPSDSVAGIQGGLPSGYYVPVP